MPLKYIIFADYSLRCTSPVSIVTLSCTSAPLHSICPNDDTRHLNKKIRMHLSSTLVSRIPLLFIVHASSRTQVCIDHGIRGILRQC